MKVKSIEMLGERQYVCGATGHGDVSLYCQPARVKLEKGWLDIVIFFSYGYGDQSGYENYNRIIDIVKCQASPKWGVEVESLFDNDNLFDPIEEELNKILFEESDFYEEEEDYDG